MVSSWERHGLLDQRPWNVLLSVSIPNQLMPVSRTVAPELSTILLPLVCRYPLRGRAACAGSTPTSPAISAPAAAATRAKRLYMGTPSVGGVTLIVTWE